MEIITTNNVWDAHPWATIKDAASDPTIKAILQLGFEIRFTPNIENMEPCGFFVQLWSGQPGQLKSRYIGLISSDTINSPEGE